MLRNLNENMRLAIYGLRRADDKVHLDKRSCKTIQEKVHKTIRCPRLTRRLTPRPAFPPRNVPLSSVEPLQGASYSAFSSLKTHCQLFHGHQRLARWNETGSQFRCDLDLRAFPWRTSVSGRQWMASSRLAGSHEKRLMEIFQGRANYFRLAQEHTHTRTYTLKGPT